MAWLQISNPRDDIPHSRRQHNQSLLLLWESKSTNNKETNGLLTLWLLDLSPNIVLK